MKDIQKNAFHSSGAMTLSYNANVLKFFEAHLINIQNYENDFELFFDAEIPSFVVEELEPFGYISKTETTMRFINLFNIPNYDVGKTLEEVDKALRTENKSVKPIEENYEKVINELLLVNDIYSTLLEIILCNLYVDEEDTVYRYQGPTKKLAKKYSVYHVSTMISPLLAMLYTPNNITMNNLSVDLLKPIEQLSILERLWLNSK